MNLTSQPSRNPSGANWRASWRANWGLPVATPPPFHEVLRLYQLVGAAAKVFWFPRVATIVYVAVCSPATYTQPSAYRDLLNNSHRRLLHFPFLALAPLPPGSLPRQLLPGSLVTLLTLCSSRPYTCRHCLSEATQPLSESGISFIYRWRNQVKL